LKYLRSLLTDRSLWRCPPAKDTPFRRKIPGLLVEWWIFCYVNDVRPMEEDALHASRLGRPPPISIIDRPKGISSIASASRRWGVETRWPDQWKTTLGGSPTRSSYKSFSGHPQLRRSSHAWSVILFRHCSLTVPPPEITPNLWRDSVELPEFSHTVVGIVVRWLRSWNKFPAPLGSPVGSGAFCMTSDRSRSTPI